MSKKVPLKNNFAVDHPNLVVLWHPTKNGDLTPLQFRSGSAKKVWWQCLAAHEYPRTPHDQVKFKGRCPICSGYRIVLSNSFLGRHPDLAKLWHPTKNGSLDLSRLAPGSEATCWWTCSEGHEYSREPVNQVKANGRCPICSTLAFKYPDIAKMWHGEKNGSLTPRDVGPASQFLIWWVCSTGHEFERTPHNHVKYAGRCPFCSGKRVRPDTCLAAIYPAIAEQWHSARNVDLTPFDVLPKSNKRAWWICPKGHEYDMLIAHRSAGLGCPYCRGLKASPDDNLEVRFPDLAKQWHPTKNGDVLPSDVRHGSTRRVWWLCSYGHSYESAVYNRSNGCGCPYCSPKTSKMEIFVYSEIAYIFPQAMWRSKIDGIEADILIPNLKVVIEVDGAYWHSKKIEADMAKTQRLQKLGFFVFRARGNGLPLLSDRDVTFQEGKRELSVITELLRLIAGYAALTKREKTRLQRYCDHGIQKNDHLYEKMLNAVNDPSIASPVSPEKYLMESGSQYNLSLGL